MADRNCRNLTDFLKFNRMDANSFRLSIESKDSADFFTLNDRFPKF